MGSTGLSNVQHLLLVNKGKMPKQYPLPPPMVHHILWHHIHDRRNNKQIQLILTDKGISLGIGSALHFCIDYLVCFSSHCWYNYKFCYLLIGSLMLHLYLRWIIFWKAILWSYIYNLGLYVIVVPPWTWMIHGDTRSMGGKRFLGYSWWHLDMRIGIYLMYVGFILIFMVMIWLRYVLWLST